MNRPEQPDHNKPTLAYTRKYGWVVAIYVSGKGFDLWLTRPGKVQLMMRDIIAFAPLPPVPEAAL